MILAVAGGILLAFAALAILRGLPTLLALLFLLYLLGSCFG